MPMSTFAIFQAKTTLILSVLLQNTFMRTNTRVAFLPVHRFRLQLMRQFLVGSSHRIRTYTCAHMHTLACPHTYACAHAHTTGGLGLYREFPLVTANPVL